MPKPTLPDILAEFEAEANRTTKWVSVDRTLLLRVCGELRRLEAQDHAAQEEIRNLEDALAAALEQYWRMNDITRAHPRILSDWQDRLAFMVDYYGRDEVQAVIDARPLADAPAPMLGGGEGS